MPVIPEMDEFINWDNAAPAVGLSSHPEGLATDSNDLDLALENVDGDDFSFWALQHYDSSNLPSNGPNLDPGLVQSQLQTFEESFETPDAPCAHCQSGGYQCKRINEGQYKGYCTSCVALRCGCSFGLAEPQARPGSDTFPLNPWPTLGDHPDPIPHEDVLPELLHSSSAPDLPSMTATAPEDSISKVAASTPKVGARFSRESVKILKNWLSTHNRHPYPSEEEKEMLQKQTGLNKTQISNWLANARRRGKVVAPRSTSPGVRKWSNAIDIPQRQGTPATFETMNPLQRWQHSPPENEPASVAAIARAVTASASTFSSGLNSPYSLNLTDDGSSRSLCAGSSASSANTSHSSAGSFASAYSHASRGSFGSFGSLNRGRRRRRRKATPKRPEEKTSLVAPLKTYQCTFCTETFRTKHDWQRHEKSLHLSLERWVCTPDRPRALNPETNQVCCVFCGRPDPDDNHIESHNHSACQERTLEERTFYRKDHLRQHLKLVHDVKFANWSMDQWKVTTPEIRSRCGFCGIVMDTWTIRVDHLAEHFKTGKTMADWKGDWGFDAPVMNMVENSIPPYLIHDERNSPMPYEATRLPNETPKSAYELLKAELSCYINSKESTGQLLTDEQLQFEACRVLYAAEVVSKRGISSAPSWLRDLLVSSEQLASQARLAPIRSQGENWLSHLGILGKDNIFEDDILESQLREYVKAREFLGLTAMDSDLQLEACNILGRMEESSPNPSDGVANFLLRLIFGSTEWLAPFRQRAHLPRSEDLVDESLRSRDPSTIDSTIHNYSRLEAELAEYVLSRRACGIEPDDADLQRQARIIIYEFDDGWNQTAADNADWLNSFKLRHLQPTGARAAPVTTNSPLRLPSAAQRQFQRTQTSSANMSQPTLTGQHDLGSFPSTVGPAKLIRPYLIIDANCYRRLEGELKRYVAYTMSPNNPTRHIPSDEELQHQSRWILYDDDDPWNQTAADNAEWLRRFKRDVGILTDPTLPGLPSGNQWNVMQGGTGFAPPYTFPNPGVQVVTQVEQSGRVSIPLCEGAKPVEAHSSTANKFLQALSTRAPPAIVFCSRELEIGLVEFVTTEVASGPFPSDEAIREKARQVLGTQVTAAEDPVLLEKFKDMVKQKLGLAQAGPQLQSQPSPGQPALLTADEVQRLSVLPPDMDINITDSELTGILQDMDFDFGDGAQ